MSYWQEDTKKNLVIEKNPKNAFNGVFLQVAIRWQVTADVGWGAVIPTLGVGEWAATGAFPVQGYIQLTQNKVKTARGKNLTTMI